MIISRRVFIRNENHEPLKGVLVEIYDTRTGKVFATEKTDSKGMVKFTRVNTATQEYWFRPRITRTSGKFDKMALSGVVNIHAELEQPPPPPPPPAFKPVDAVVFDPPVPTFPFPQDTGGPQNQPTGVTEYTILWDCANDQQLEGYDATLATSFGETAYLSAWNVVSMVVEWADASYWVLFQTASDYRIRHYSATGTVLTTITLDTTYSYHSIGYDGTYLYVTTHDPPDPFTLILQQLDYTTGAVVNSISAAGDTTSGVYASQTEARVVWIRTTGVGLVHEMQGYNTATLASVWGPTNIDLFSLQAAVVTNVVGQFFVAIGNVLGNIIEVREYLVTDGTLIDTLAIAVTGAGGGMAWYDTQFFIPDDTGVVHIFDATGALVDSVDMVCTDIAAIVAKPSPE